MAVHGQYKPGEPVPAPESSPPLPFPDAAAGIALRFGAKGSVALSMVGGGQSTCAVVSVKEVWDHPEVSTD